MITVQDLNIDSEYTYVLIDNQKCPIIWGFSTGNYKMSVMLPLCKTTTHATGNTMNQAFENLKIAYKNQLTEKK
jgi:hypothetical protein